MTTTTDTPTRERILTAAVDLFAAQGFKGTTVGEIEAAAGLAPRAGGFYKHFPSKDAVLEAALAAHDDEIAAIAAAITSRPRLDLRAELTMMARVALYSLESERKLAQIVMKEGERFPELRDGFYDRFVLRGLALAEALVTDLCDRAGIEATGVRTTAELLLAGLVGYRLQGFMFDRVPGDVDEDDFVDAWVESACALFRSRGVDAPPDAGGTA